MEKTLHVTLKKKWFDLESHPDPAIRKNEEYREIKPYWVTRLISFDRYPKEAPDDCKNFAEDICFDIFANGHPPLDVIKATRSSFKGG